MVISETGARVSENTAETVNASIQRQTKEGVAYYASAGSEAIERRLEELDREWDIEHVGSKCRRPHSDRSSLGSGQEPQMVRLPWLDRRVSVATCRAGVVSAAAQVAPPGVSHCGGDQP